MSRLDQNETGELHNLDRLELWLGANEHAFAHGPTGMAVIDEAGDIVRVNHLLCTLLGVDEHDLLGQPLVRFANSEHVPAIREWLTAGPEAHPPTISGRAWYRRPDTSSLWLEADLTRVVTDGGHYELAMVRDLTAAKVMQEALRRSNEELDALVANAPVAIYKVDPLGRVLLWNAAAERIFGWRATEVLGHPLPIVEAGRWDQHIGRLIDSLEGNGEHGDEVVRRHRDGRALTVSMWTSPVHDASGEAEAVLTVAMDVTDQHQATTALAESERRFRSLVQHISDSVTLIGEDGRIQSTTGQTKDVLGYPPGWWDGRHLFDLAHPDDLDRTRTMFETIRGVHGRELTAEIRARHRDGSWALIEMTGINLLDDPTVRGIVVTTRNVTQARRDQRLLAGQASILETIAAGGGADATFREVTEMIQDLVPGATAQVLVPDGDQLVPRTPASVDLSQSGVVAVTVVDPTASTVQAVLAVDPRGGGMTGDDESVLETAQRLISIAIERQEAEERLVHQGLHDQLTGLPNRTLLLDRLDHAVTRARHGDQQVAVLFIDLDGFKVVNDSLGHGAGDHVLTEFSERLRRLVRPEDTVARFGGDEFVVVCEQSNGPAVILSIAERLNQSMAEAFRLTNGIEVFLTMSMGVAAGEVADAPSLLRNADAAMYRAKELGRNRLEVFDDAMRAAAVRRLTLGNDLRRAVERHEFVVHFQPVLGIDGTVRGAEALVRWQHPERGLLPPSQFISVTEEMGLIDTLGEQVLDQALSDAAGWQADGLDPITVSVNLSARQLADPDLTTKVQRALDRHRVDPSHLCLELTESVLMDDIDRVHTVLTGLTALGIHLAIDDFGTGWSSLTYLHRLPVDQLKIDRSFVKDLGSTAAAESDTQARQGQAIVSAVLGMAHAFDLKVVAEGVEHRRQLDCLRQLGCDLAQGLYFSAPLPSAEFVDYWCRTGAPRVSH